MCDLSVEGAKLVNVLQINNCTYEYHFTSRYGCYTTFIKDFRYISIYVMFIMMVSMVMIGYCFGFMILNYRNCPEDGVIKALPHRSFWISVVRNVSHFIDVLYKIVKRKHNRSNLDNY